MKEKGRRRPPRLPHADARVREAAPRRGSTSPPAPEHLCAVLSDLHFPARRWQIVTVAEMYGADQRTLCALRQLSGGIFEDLRAVIDELAVVAAP